MHAEYEPTSTHLSKSDRVMIYMIFAILLAATTYFYSNVGDVWYDRFMLYATVAISYVALWAWAAGHYSKKFRRFARQETQQQVSQLRVVLPLGEARYAYKGEVMPLADALGVNI